MHELCAAPVGINAIHHTPRGNHVCCLVSKSLQMHNVLMNNARQHVHVLPCDINFAHKTSSTPAALLHVQRCEVIMHALAFSW